MAKKKSVVNMSLLSSIATGATGYISQADALPLLNHEPPLIDVNTSALDDSGNAKVWLTDAGKVALPNGNAAKAAVSSDTPQYAIISNAIFVPSEKKRGGRGGGGAPTIYPWASMEVGNTFFVGVSQKPDPFKSMQSAVSSANMKYSEEVGDPVPHTRTMRGPGNKAVVDAAGNPVKETINKKKRQAVRKFDLRAFKKGEALGNWVAPEDGVLVGRIL